MYRNPAQKAFAQRKFVAVCSGNLCQDFYSFVRDFSAYAIPRQQENFQFHRDSLLRRMCKCTPPNDFSYQCRNLIIAHALFIVGEHSELAVYLVQLFSRKLEP